MEKQISKIALNLFFITVLIFGCAKQDAMNDEYVIQIKNVGLREGVFVRRYKMTKEYGSHEIFTVEILKNFIRDVLEPDYLLLQDAYDRGMNKESIIQRKIKDYRINLLASSHPIQYKNMTITSDELRGFYQKKSIKYNLELIQTNSYNSADSIYKSMLAGKKIEHMNKKEEPGFRFPKYSHFKNITFGEILHPDLFPKLEQMKEGEISDPVYTSPMWTIVKLNKKGKNRDLQSFESIQKELLIQGQTIFRYEKQKQLINELREKNQIDIRAEFYQPMIAAYTFKKNHGWIDKNKLNKSDLNNTFIKINRDEISLSNFISSFNQAFKFIRFPSLREEDLSHFVDSYIVQYLLYLDALEQGVDQNVLIKDKLENKEYKILLSKYLKEEIAQKVVISDDDARKHYVNNRNKWKAKYEDVASLVKNDLKNKRLLEKKNELVNKFRKKYKVRYNEPLLKEVAEKLTKEKKLKNKEVIKH